MIFLSQEFESCKMSDFILYRPPLWMPEPIDGGFFSPILKGKYFCNESGTQRSGKIFDYFAEKKYN